MHIFCLKKGRFAEQQHSSAHCKVFKIKIKVSVSSALVLVLQLLTTHFPHCYYKFADFKNLNFFWRPFPSRSLWTLECINDSVTQHYLAMDLILRPYSSNHKSRRCKMQPHCNLTNLPSISWQAEGEEQNLSAHDKRTREGDENDKN